MSDSEEVLEDVYSEFIDEEHEKIEEAEDCLLKEVKYIQWSNENIDRLNFVNNNIEKGGTIEANIVYTINGNKIKFGDLTVNKGSSGSLFTIGSMYSFIDRHSDLYNLIGEYVHNNVFPYSHHYPYYYIVMCLVNYHRNETIDLDKLPNYENIPDDGKRKSITGLKKLMKVYIIK